MDPNDDSSEHAASSNIASDEIDTETASKLRGDAIGNTMYSEVFVLNTLIQFSDLKWSSEVEDNLCFLWDMTEEQDVCQYLFKVSYPSLACSAIQNYTEPRFIEIVVGIFTNLLCSQCEKQVKEEEIKTVLNLLNSDDPYILIQVMRFVHAVSFMFDKLDFIDEGHLKRFDFILMNSTNKELLARSLKSLTAITDDRKVRGTVIKGELLKSAVMAYQVLKEDCEPEFDTFDSKDKQLNIRHLIQFVCNMCSYVDVLDVTHIVNKLKENLDPFTREIVILLNYYKSEHVLLPVDEQILFYIEAVTYIYKVLSVGYIPEVARALYEMVLIMYSNDSTSINIVAELFCYFIAVGNLEILQEEFGHLPIPEVKEVLTYIQESNFTFDFDYVSNLRKILNVL